MDDLYRKHFQKSKAFLYPVLGLSKFRDPSPENVYTSWGEDYDKTDRKLICVYEQQNTEAWKNFKLKLMTHPMLEVSIIIDDVYIAYVFNFDIKEYQQDFDYFLLGQYSKLSSNTKKAISNYYGIHTAEWVYVESYIYPKKYYEQYSKILNVPVEQLKEGVELCSRHNDQDEECPYPMNELFIN